METTKLTLIKSKEQYNKYCTILENLLEQDSFENQDEIELLTFLIERWDNEHNTFKAPNPVEMLKSLMEEHGLKTKDLTVILGLTKGTLSKILNYKSGFSKTTIRKLSVYFRVTQEAFNRPYPLNIADRKPLRKASHLSGDNKMTADR